LRDAIGENEAAGLLGLPVHVLTSLADRELLDRLRGPVVALVPERLTTRLIQYNGQ
jgi:hypothetical protein